jgi:uncharacterized protein YeaO (DUF488 family)
MPLWTTYLSNIATHKGPIIEYIAKNTDRANPNRLVFIPKFVMRNRGNNAVAPTEELLKKYKNGEASWAAYRFVYESLLLSDEAYSWMDETAMEVNEGRQVILVCFEKNDEHCHRRLLAERIQGLFSVDYRGELPSFAKENKG